MPLPEKIKPSHAVWVVWTLVGPHYVADDRDEAKAYKKQMEADGHAPVTIRKYTAGRGADGS